jgi:long-chain acyl-CoA synthetase
MHRTELWRSLRDAALPFGDRKAISMPQAEMTFENLFGTAEQLSRALERAGVAEGDVVGLSLPNSPAFVPAFLGLVKVSAIVALVSPLYRANELKILIEGVQPRCFLVEPKAASTMLQWLEAERTETIAVPGLGELALVFPRAAAPGGSGRPGVQASARSDERAALVKFSSGSTGIPKGVLLTADNLLAEARNVIATLGIVATDCIHAPVPVFHSYGFDLGVLPMLFAGATLALRDAFIPRRLLADLASREVSIFLGVPSIYRTLLETPLSSIPDLSHVRYLLSCTAPLPPDLIAAFHGKFGVPICQHYGSSETGAATTHVPSEVLAHPASVGLPMSNVRITIRDERGVVLPLGEAGEVFIQSKVVAPGYLMGHPEGPSRFLDDTYQTGDIGLLDQDGLLYLLGRKDDVINVGGLKVSPSEVVKVLEAFPPVREAAVIGARNDAGEEFVYAAVTLKSPATEQEMIQYCQARLSNYKVPRRIDILEHLPRGASGKIKLNPEDLHL